MTAEFAIALPAVILVLAIAIGGMQLAGEQVRLAGAVADAARLLGRGDTGAVAVIHRAAPGARVSDFRRDDLVCVAANSRGGLGMLPAVTISARACALADGSPPGVAPARATR